MTFPLPCSLFFHNVFFILRTESLRVLHLESRHAGYLKFRQTVFSFYKNWTIFGVSLCNLLFTLRMFLFSIVGFFKSALWKLLCLRFVFQDALFWYRGHWVSECLTQCHTLVVLHTYIFIFSLTSFF